MTNNNNKKRVHLSALQKRKALIEISRGKNAKDVITSETNSSDKKYSSKMYHKWKKEHFSKKPDMQQYGFGNDLSDIDIKYEIESFEFENISSQFIFDKYNNNTLVSGKSCFKNGYLIFSNMHMLYADFNN